MSVAELSERQPHMTVETQEAVHVFPVALLRDVIAGRQLLSAMDESVVRAMLGDYLSMFEV